MLSEEELKVIETLKKGYGLTKAETEILSNLIEKQRKETKEYTKFKKAIVNRIMMWDKKELPDNEVIINVLDTFVAEISRLEDIEDEKIQVEVKFIEEKRDKYWEKKIEGKIKELEEVKTKELENDDEFRTHSMKWAIADYVIETLNDLLKED